MFLRAPYNYDVDEASLDAGTVNDKPSMTDESFGEECDINTIVRRFGLTGEMPQPVVVPTYADFERTYDYHSALLEIRRAESEFMRLPAAVRARFDNDAGSLLAFLEDDKNREEAVSLGLVHPKPGASPGEGVAAPG